MAETNRRYTDNDPLPYNERKAFQDRRNNPDYDTNFNRNRPLGSEGGHRGKGPRGYRRSDERIQEDINDRLTEDDQLDASGIDVQVQNSEVILSGSVANKADKRRAEDIAESVPGVQQIENRIHVQENIIASFAHSIVAGIGAVTTGHTNTHKDAD